MAVGVMGTKQTVTSPGYMASLAASQGRTAFSKAAAQANAANKERYAQGMSLWDEIIQRYQPGGAFGAGAMASYERGKTQALGAGMQQLVSSGLANTTVAATMGKKYEEEVGSPFRQQLADMQMGRLSEAQAGKAGFIERREDVGPSAQVAAQSGYQAGYGQGGGGGGGGDNFTMPGFNEDWMDTRRSPFGGGGGGTSTFSPTGGGGGGGGGRAPSPNYQRTLDIGRITYQGEASRAGEFSPTGTGGEAMGPPAPEGYNDPGYAENQLKTAMKIPGNIQTRMQNGQLMMQIRPQGYSSLKWVQANQYERSGGQWRKTAGGGTSGVTGAQIGGYTSPGQGRY